MVHHVVHHAVVIGCRTFNIFVRAFDVNVMNCVRTVCVVLNVGMGKFVMFFHD